MAIKAAAWMELQLGHGLELKMGKQLVQLMVAHLGIWMVGC
jgi:hypothetical protein